jgi:predicted lipoprotein with Yx(FWY)xxD motif
MWHRLGFVLLVVFASGLASSAMAEWQPDGVDVCTNADGGDGGDRNPRMVSDGAGGAIITWFDYRNGSGDIFAQRISAAGVPMWAANGVALCTESAHQFDPAIASDGSGGAIITWSDYRNGSSDIYARRVNASGVPQWTADGVAICTDADNQYVPKIVPDGAGGAIVAWEDHRSAPTSDIYARRVNASGVPQWTADGVPLTASANDQTNFTMIPDGAGGAFVTWEDYRGDDADIYLQRVSATGLLTWTPDGIAVCNAADWQYAPKVATDGAGDAIVTWDDNRSGSGYPDIYAQRVHFTGAVWTSNGVAICSDPGLQLDPTIASDGAGGAIVVWADYRDGVTPILYGQRVNAAGSAQWMANGIAVSTGAVDRLAIVPDGVGGAVVGWVEDGNYLRAQRLAADGSLQWAPAGLPVCTIAAGPSQLQMVADGSQGALAAWQDYRNSEAGIYASIANGNTPAGANVVVSPTDATTGGTPVTVTFDGVGNGSTSLVTGPSGPVLPGTFTPGDGKYYDISTTATFSGGVEVCITYDESGLAVAESAVRLLHYDTTLHSWADITTSLDTGLNKVCGVTTSLSPFVIGAVSVTGIGDAPIPARLALHQNFPNPFKPTTTIAFDVPRSGAEVRVSIYDVAGKQVRSLADRLFEPGVHRVSWDGRDDRGQGAAPGVYYCRIESGGFRQAMKMMLLR